MSKITSTATLSSHFNIDSDTLEKLNVIDVLLESDTLLFIDPLLLPDSQHEEMSKKATCLYNERFTNIITLLKLSKNIDDPAWKAAKKMFSFSEVGWTCLGYGTSDKGSGFGPRLVENTMVTASKIINLNVENPDLFMVLSLFEEGIGADRVSDMTTNIIFDALIDFTLRVNQELKLDTMSFNFNKKEYVSILNPLTNKPLVLVPQDVVRDLPISIDWGGAISTMKENIDLRDRINANFGTLLASMTRKEKEKVKERALKSKEYFQDLLDLLSEIDRQPYNFETDKNGELFWMKLSHSMSKNFPFDLSKYKKKLTLDEVESLVIEIIEQFQDLVENKGLWKEMWADNNTPRKEKAAQRLLFAVAYSYCKANNLDISPEADSGNGPVDFKVSQGFNEKVVVEIKLSSNPRLTHGYEKQLEIYKKAEDTERGIFIIIDVGFLRKKHQEVQKIRNDFITQYKHASTIYLIDAHQKASASKRT